MTEDLNTEYKKEYADSILKTVIAFSNTAGGRILVGVDDDGSYVGVENIDLTARKCVSSIADKIRPDVTSTTCVNIVGNDVKIIEIIVNEGDKKPYYLREKGLRAESVYVRNGSSSMPVTDEGFYKMIQSIRSASYESQMSFRQDLTFNYLKKMFSEKNLPLDEEHMRIMHIIENGKYTNLGFMLSDQFDQPVKMASFRNRYKNEFLDRSISEGSVLKHFDDAMDFMMKYNKLSSKIAGKTRIDTYAFHPEVLREAMINAIAHRDYSINSTILVSVYPDRITIVSPGGLNTPYSVKELFSGVSSLRNRNLADILYRLKLIEAYGTGLPRISEAYRNLQNKPEIETGAASFMISLPASDIKNDNLEKFISDRSEFTRDELQKSLNTTKSDANFKIKTLMEQGKIIKIGGGRSTKYAVVNI